MSYSALGWAGEQQTQTSAEKLVLFQLAWHSNQETGLCNPSVATLASETRLSPSTVKRAIAGLVRQELVELRSGREGFNQSNHYLLRWFTMSQHVGSPCTTRWFKSGSAVGSPRPTNKVKEQGIEQDIKKSSSSPSEEPSRSGMPANVREVLLQSGLLKG